MVWPVREHFRRRVLQIAAVAWVAACTTPAIQIESHGPLATQLWICSPVSINASALDGGVTDAEGADCGTIPDATLVDATQPSDASDASTVDAGDATDSGDARDANDAVSADVVVMPDIICKVQPVMIDGGTSCVEEYALNLKLTNHTSDPISSIDYMAFVDGPLRIVTPPLPNVDSKCSSTGHLCCAAPWTLGYGDTAEIQLALIHTNASHVNLTYICGTSQSSTVADVVGVSKPPPDSSWARREIDLEIGGTYGSGKTFVTAQTVTF